MKRWTPTFCQTRVVLSEAEEKGESEYDEELETDESIWIEELTTRTDVDFNQAVGMAVDPASLNSRNDSFERITVVSPESLFARRGFARS